MRIEDQGRMEERDGGRGCGEVMKAVRTRC